MKRPTNPNDDRPEEYHQSFWGQVDSHPDGTRLSQEFENSDYDWNACSDEIRQLLQAFDRKARKDSGIS
jgi:hypothetical protein